MNLFGIFGMPFDCPVERIGALLDRVGRQGAGWHGHGDTLALWLFFAACGLAELGLGFLVGSALERTWPLTQWQARNSITADVVYALFVRVVIFPLVAYFEYAWLQASLAGFFAGFPSEHGRTIWSLAGFLPRGGWWPAVGFAINFAVLDLADYWRHRLSHRYGWWYGIHSLHHAEDQMTLWSDDRSHVLEDAITYLWLIAVGLAIGVPAFQFPFLILGFRFVGALAHANTQARYGWLGERILVSPQFHRTHHALRAAGRRSTNYGTALPWWDMLFGTARFQDTTVETGDAGAEPALVNGSWGAQQRAGIRRMMRLGKLARRKAAAVKAA